MRTRGLAPESQPHAARLSVLEWVDLVVAQQASNRIGRKPQISRIPVVCGVSQVAKLQPERLSHALKSLRLVKRKIAADRHDEVKGHGKFVLGNLFVALTRHVSRAPVVAGITTVAEAGGVTNAPGGGPTPIPSEVA